MKRAWILAAVVCVAGFAGADEPKDPPTAVNRVSAVTLYRGSARVTRTVDLPAKQGELQLLVGNLPGSIVPDSLSAVGSNGTIVRMVQFRRKAVLDTRDPKVVKDIKAKIEAVDREMRVLAAKQSALRAKGKYLDKLEGFTSTKVSEKAATAGVDLKTLTETTEFLFAERDKLVAAKVKLDEAIRELNEKRTDLREQLGVTAVPNAPSLQMEQQRAQVGPRIRQELQAILHVHKADAKAGTLQLQYLVNGTNWTPSYIAKLDEKANTVRLEYTAAVYQASGEDWSNVDLTLSTAQPMLNCEIPLLTPMILGIAVGGQQSTFEQALRSSSNVYVANQSNAMGWNNAADGKGNRDRNWRMNKIAMAQQIGELRQRKEQVLEQQFEARRQLEGMAVTYALPGGMSLPNQAAVQLVPIVETTLKADTYYEASPLISPFVFRGARIVNTSESLLLDGEYKAYVGRKFVGRGRMARTANGQAVNLGFGVDTQLLCHRKLVDKKSAVSWGKRTQTFQYELSVENFSNTSREVRLYGRYPTSKNPQIETRLTETNVELCKDADYIKQLKSKGILRWDVKVQPGQKGVDAKTVGYTYEIKCPEDMPMEKALDVAPAAAEEFNEAVDLRKRM